MVKDLEKLQQITSQLRDPEKGCPWDKEQTFESIAHCAIEEAYGLTEDITTYDGTSIDEDSELLNIPHTRISNIPKMDYV